VAARALTWRVTDFDGDEHTVAVATPTGMRGPSRRFVVDGVVVSLGGPFHRGDRSVEFRVGRSRGGMTRRRILPRLGIRLRRGLRILVRPWRLVGYLLGPAIGNALLTFQATSTWLEWTIYTLRVDGRQQGSWVIRTVGQRVERTVFVAPGGVLPDGSTESWPGN
jgi:hypothetical protein